MATKKPNRNGAKPERPAQGVYFLSLSLENARCFGPKQTLDLSDGNGRPARWTILLGNNGAGKTTVLQALAGLGPVPGNKFNLLAEQWLMDGSAPAWFRAGKNLTTMRAEIASETALDTTSTGPIARSHSEVTLWRDRIAGEPDMGFEMTPVQSRPLFCIGFGAARRLGTGMLGKKELANNTASLFSDRAELRNGEEWLLVLDYVVSKRPDDHKPKERFGLIKDLLLKIMPEGEVEDIRCVAGSGTHPQSKVEFKTPYGWVPLRHLGYGYQTLIAWMMDFASRMVERYPDIADPLAEPAIVLVDEIDLHLHPSWQRKLIGFLTERFPNTQFIATAHSPLVVQAAAGANFAVLRREGDHIVIDQSFQGIANWRIDQVLTSPLFGLDSARPPELAKLLARRTRLLQKSRLSAAAKSELKQLERQIGDLPGGETATEAEEIRRLTRRTQELLEKYQPERP